MSPIKQKNKQPRNLGNRVVFLTISRRVTRRKVAPRFNPVGLATPQLDDKLEPY